MKYATKKRLLGVCAAVLTLAVLIALNAAFGLLPERFARLDATDKRLMSVSGDASARVKALSGEATVWLVNASDEENLWIEGYLDRLCALNGGLTLKRCTDAQERFGQSLSEYSVVLESGLRTLSIPAEEIIVTSYTTYNEQQYLTGMTFEAEDRLVRGLEYVTSASVRSVYAITGHEEAALPVKLQSALAEANVEVKSLTLADGVPEDAQTLVLNAPAQPLSDEDVRTLRAYLDNGGDLLVTTAYDYQNAALDALLAEYGMENAGGVVMDGTQSYSGYPYYLFPTVASSDLTGDLLADGDTLVIAFASDIKIRDEVPDGVSVVDLLKTSDAGYKRAPDADYASLEMAETDEKGVFRVGLYASKSTNNGTSRVVWVSSSNFLNEGVLSGGDDGNAAFLIDMSYADAERPEAASKLPAVDMMGGYLAITSQSSVCLTAMAFGVPALLLVFGLIVCLRNRRKAA